MHREGGLCAPGGEDLRLRRGAGGHERGGRRPRLDSARFHTRMYTFVYTFSIHSYIIYFYVYIDYISLYVIKS